MPVLVVEDHTKSAGFSRKALPSEGFATHICRRVTDVTAAGSATPRVWDNDFDPGAILIDVYVRRFREKIDAAYEPKLLHAVRGSGYVLRANP